MKRSLTVLIASFVIFHSLNAQTNPALLTNFRIDGNLKNGYKISWNVANNEVATKFEVQKSVDGVVYTSLTVISASHRTGAATYSWNMESVEPTKLMYRLKMTSKGQETYYSNIIILIAKTLSDNKVDLLGNPVKDKLTLRFNEHQNGTVEFRIFDLSGRVIDDRKLSNIEKHEIVNIPLSTHLAGGIYIVEINNGIERITNKFIIQ